MSTVSRTLAAATPADVSLSPLARRAGLLTLAAGALFTLTQGVMLARVAQVDPTDLHAREALFADPVYLMAAWSPSSRSA
jgi:hypothetical protein